MKTPAYIFFRRCTLPSQLLQRFIMEGGHRVGLHLENSRTYGTFKQELFYLQKYINAPIEGFSNHGSGEHRYGRRYYAPYEPNKYISWENQQGLKYFFSNQQDPTLRPVRICSIICLPSALWLEPYLRYTQIFDVQWLLRNALQKDIYLLLPPDNVVICPTMMRDLFMLLENLGTKFI